MLKKQRLPFRNSCEGVTLRANDRTCVSLSGTARALLALPVLETLGMIEQDDDDAYGEDFQWEVGSLHPKEWLRHGMQRPGSAFKIREIVV